jgi:hypothetical protein
MLTTAESWAAKAPSRRSVAGAFMTSGIMIPSSWLDLRRGN